MQAINTLSNSIQEAEGNKSREEHYTSPHVICKTLLHR